MTESTTPQRDENGFVAIITAICFASFMFGCAALGVDVARWYVEVQRVQRAADAGALGGVTYLPQDLATATSTAVDFSTRNGYPNSGTSTVSVTQGTKKSQLQVTVCSTIPNSFGGYLGIKDIKICRLAVADFTGPAPLGSPCNTFGNEPPAGGGPSAPVPTTGSALAPVGTRFLNCTPNPQMWGQVEGPQVDKVQGDRFQTLTCAAGTDTDGCDSSKNNNDYDPAGYFYLVHVQPESVGHTVDLQLFVPGFVYTGSDCGDDDPAWASATQAANNYVTDARNRYGTTATAAPATNGGTSYCPGDSFPGGAPGTSSSNTVTTSYAMRQQSDTLNPKTAPVLTDTTGKTCIRQYQGFFATRKPSKTTVYSGPLVSDLTKGNSGYEDEVAKEFHNWTSFCKFTPTRSGDYYLQVRTDVAAGGTALGSDSIAYQGNSNVISDSANLTTGYGANSFAIRAVTDSGYENQVSVSSYDKMPISVNANNANPTFNLIRVLPGAAGKAISFSYFDVGDAATGTGTVTVKMPSDAKNKTGTVTYVTAPAALQFPNGCRAIGGYATTSTTLANCSAPFTGGTNGTNNGKIETISIPIPSDYTCDYASLGGCWYQVQVTFPNGSVHDTTTWTADIIGQPVRLIE